MLAICSKKSYILKLGTKDHLKFISHTILNNLQALVKEIPLVMFFPGNYNNFSLNLFGRLKDDNYYRAFNLNEYTI